jgi:hypothetical protein
MAFGLFKEKTFFQLSPSCAQTTKCNETFVKVEKVRFVSERSGLVVGLTSGFSLAQDRLLFADQMDYSFIINRNTETSREHHLWSDATPSHGVFTLTDKLIGIDGQTAPSITSERPMN